MDNQATLNFDCDENNTFNKVKVYLAGTLLNKKELIFKLENSNAILRSDTGALFGLSKNIFVIIRGEKISDIDIININKLKNNGFNIPIITEKKAFDILNNKCDMSFNEPIKNIDITFNFIFSSINDKIEHMNFYELYHTLSQKEILMPLSNDLLFQLIGNIGSCITKNLDTNTIDYIWLSNDCIENLKNGIKDDFIKYIEKSYNSSSSDIFNYKFIVGKELFYWLEYRAERCNDEISLYYIDIIKKSKINL